MRALRYTAPPGEPMTRYAYTAWDGIQDSAALSPAAVLEALTNDLLQSGDLQRALHDFLRRADTSSDGVPSLSDDAALSQAVVSPQQEGLPPSAADAVQQPEQQVQQLEAFLHQAGLVRRTTAGLRLTSQGARQIGAKALRDIFHTG